MILDLGYNDLKQITTCLLQLAKLVRLDLLHNQLEEIPDIPEWSSSLAVVDLSHNHLGSLSPNVIAPSMRTLNVAFNCFSHVYVYNHIPAHHVLKCILATSVIRSRQ